MGRCSDSHKPMPIPKRKGKGVWYVNGGNCNVPSEGADVIVALDRCWSGSKMQLPWNEGTAFQFLIPDMQVPTNAESFKKLIKYLAGAVNLGSSVFVGCIGGHGRTGMVLAALVTEMTGMKDSITYVRENYCDHAVETKSQVEWLNKHFGITKIKGSYETDHTPVPWAGQDVQPVKSAKGKPKDVRTSGLFQGVKDSVLNLFRAS